MTALAFSLAALEAIPALLRAGADASGFASRAASALSAMQAAGRDPTDAEWAALDAQIVALRGRLVPLHSDFDRLTVPRLQRG